MQKLLVANRGEIAVRVMRAASELRVPTVAISPEDDRESQHVAMADESFVLPGAGAAAYLDIEAVLAAAAETNCDAIHPGYGFLSERSDFARACAEAGLTFVGPTPELLSLFGDKARAREAALAADVPVLRGLNHAVSLEEARDFMSGVGDGRGVMLKAVAGGGGRGSRAVTDPEMLESAYRSCQSEARAAFGQDALYIEEFLPRARHVEVQILGDVSGAVMHLGERECSVQRRFQKIVEVAPAPGLSAELRQQIIAAAMRFAKETGYRSLGTFEFLVDASGQQDAQPFVFIEANARLQVEHTVTEVVTGVDLVQAQLRLADGAQLSELGLDDPMAATPRGHAIQARVNLETLMADGSVRPGGGVITAYEPPGGPGVRVDGFGYVGYETSGLYDSLLAKVIVHASGARFDDAAWRTSRALDEFRLEGVETNIPFLKAVIDHADFVTGAVHTRWVDEKLAELVETASNHRSRFHATNPEADEDAGGHAGARVDARDPLALFAHDAQTRASKAKTVSTGPAAPAAPEGATGLKAPIQGTILSVDVAIGDLVRKGQQVAVVEAMKMEHVIHADHGGLVRKVTMKPGDVVRQGFPVVFVEAGADDGLDEVSTADAIDPDHIRADLQEVIDRHALTLDENRPEVVAKRHGMGFRMPRENIAHLADPGSFQEYWPLVVAYQHQRHDMASLRKRTPADGVVAGTCSINGDLFPDDRSRAMIVSYDYTVLAGTQGRRNHYKQDRLYELADRFRLPLILFSEGGGGRPGDDNTGPRVAIDTTTFTTFSKLSGLVPMVGINNGRCFAGNTALLACCDVIIATEASTIAMGGPAMIEGGGLGIYTPEEIGPMSFQVPNGVVDILVKDEEAAVDAAKKYLSYFQGPIDEWEAPDQRTLRHVIPENRVRLYDMRDVLHNLADRDSILEIREQFGIGVITAFIRIEGRPMGVLANNPHHLAGAIDSDGADKAARFMQLCDAFDIPVLSLVDCPGIMVGPDVEREALVRHSARMFNVGANMTTPLFTVIVRKCYGLGAQAMCGGGTLVGFMTVAWPTAEFAGMNIEGSVKLGYRNELMAIEDPDERLRMFQESVDTAYETARAVNSGTGGGIDDVIDPADTRAWIAGSMKRLPPVPPRDGKKYPFIDTW